MESDSKQQAEKKKTLGNNEFKKGNFQAAINFYTEAIGKVFSAYFIQFLVPF